MVVARKFLWWALFSVCTGGRIFGPREFAADIPGNCADSPIKNAPPCEQHRRSSKNLRTPHILRRTVGGSRKPKSWERDCIKNQAELHKTGDRRRGARKTPIITSYKAITGITPRPSRGAAPHALSASLLQPSFFPQRRRFSQAKNGPGSNFPTGMFSGERNKKALRRKYWRVQIGKRF